MNLRHLLSRVLARRLWLSFSRINNQVKKPPYLEGLCLFKHPQNIYLGNRVRFLRGATVLADLKGRIILEDDVIISRFAVIESIGGNIRIGKRSGVGDFSNLYGQGGVDIGEDVMIASGCRIVPTNHGIDDPSLPISRQPSSSKGIKIGNGTWVGTNVVILDGVSIGIGAVIGAGSVVTRNVPDYAIVAGVPAKILRFRPGFTAPKLIPDN
jgi:acetyltransferase-like isoleucine patch superfamily enzyme